MVAENYPMDMGVGCSEQAFGLGLHSDGNIYHLGKKQTASFGTAGFTKGDVVGCGLMMAQQQTKNDEAAKCEQCNKPHVFFTKNGEFWGRNFIHGLIVNGQPFSAEKYFFFAEN